jgi:hypothetical protein
MHKPRRQRLVSADRPPLSGVNIGGLFGLECVDFGLAEPSTLKGNLRPFGETGMGLSWL